MNRCKICGKNAYSDYCFQHKYNSLSKGITKSIILKNTKMKEFFKLIWKNRSHCSEISGEKIIRASSLNFHHILLKSKFPQAAFDEANLIILSQEEHGNVHIDIFRYPEINQRREELLIKYKI